MAPNRRAPARRGPIPAIGGLLCGAGAASATTTTAPSASGACCCSAGATACLLGGRGARYRRRGDPVARRTINHCETVESVTCQRQTGLSGVPCDQHVRPQVDDLKPGLAVQTRCNMLTLYLARATPAAGGLVGCMRGDGRGPHTAHMSGPAAAADKAAHACRRILRAAGAAVMRVLHDKRAAGYDAGKRGRRRRLGSRRHHVLCGAAALCCSGLGCGHGRARSIWRGLWRWAGTPHAGARLDAGRPQPPGWRRRLLGCSDGVGWVLVLVSRRCHTEHVGICSSCCWVASQ